MESADRLVGEEWTHTVRNKRQPTTRPQHQVGHVTPEHPAVVIERRVVRLRFVDDLDIRSIAQTIGQPRATTHDILSGAIGKLRERVGARV
jgi:hypothetical protein